MKTIIKTLCGITILLTVIWFGWFHISVTKGYDGRWYTVNSYIGTDLINSHNFGYYPNDKDVAEAKDEVYKYAKTKRKFKYGF